MLFSTELLRTLSPAWIVLSIYFGNCTSLLLQDFKDRVKVVDHGISFIYTSQALAHPPLGALKEIKVEYMNFNNMGRIHLHTSGSCGENSSPGGFGGIFLNADGGWRLGYPGHLGSTSRRDAELWAIYRGLTVLHQEGWFNVVVESSSKEAVDLVNSEFFMGSSCSEIIMQIRRFLRSNKCTMQCTARERSPIADALANMGASSVEELAIYWTRPDQLRV